jgi:hypothetical protein
LRKPWEAPVSCGGFPFPVPGAADDPGRAGSPRTNPPGMAGPCEGGAPATAIILCFRINLKFVIDIGFLYTYISPLFLRGQI